jgi:aminoglycoside 2'-N-acetyltransferase I
LSDPLFITISRTTDLTIHQYDQVLALCSTAFECNFAPFLETFGNSTHILGLLDECLVCHALWITRWFQTDNLPILRTAYVEAMATREAYRGLGYASLIMRELHSHIQDYDIGGLSTGVPHFYERLGWQRWRGPLFSREAEGLRATPEEQGVMILRLPRTPFINPNAPLSVEWRKMEVW